jgi:ElaB/YqjD/DUF883 family membrane-anchored ribosome-binding protein
MKLRLIALVAALSLPVLAEDKSLIDQANEGLAKTRESVKSGAKKAQNNTDDSLQRTRPKVKSAAKNAEDNTNDALHRARKKVGTEK